MEIEHEYASKGVAGTGLGTGIAGLALGVLNSVGGLGLAMGGKPTCAENIPVNRYDLEQAQKIAHLESEIALRDADAHNDRKILDVYQFVNAKVEAIEQQIAAQAVINQKTADSFAMANQDLAAVKTELIRDIQLEAERRCCGDNSIVTYANATFYPKMVANVTTGDTTTPQPTYNPLPYCG